MFELLINPKKAERRPWEMFFVGLFYSVLSVIIANYIFGSSDAKYIGIWIITFTVILTIPFVYFLFRVEEKKDLVYDGAFRIFKEHQKALISLTWLFLGLLIGYSICYMFLPKENFLPQIETFCAINQANNFDSCVKQYSLSTGKITGYATSSERFLGIFINNMQVFIFTLIFSILFGAGGIFVLAWNATVIASAIGIYSKSQINMLPLALARYMIHGIPEIASYLIAALAGGILSIAVIKGDYRNKKFLDIMQDILILAVVAMIILALAALIEVFITPSLFNF